MTLAEALLIRSDLQKNLAQLKVRIANNVKVQEGDLPRENPNELIKTAENLVYELATLIARIHRTNAAAKIESGETMLSLLVKRDELEMRHKLIIDAIEVAHSDTERYSPREIRWTATIATAPLQRQADEIAMQLRKLNTVIQANNWQIQLLD